MTALEAFTNATIGLIVSWLACFYILGYTPGESVGVTAMFFGLSFARAFIIREAFRRWQS